MITLVLAVGISILVSALCSLLESVLYSTRLVTLEAAGGQMSVPTQRMLGFRTEIERPLSAILILNTVANTAGAALAGWAAGQVWGGQSLWVFSLSFTAAILVFSEILPKTVGALYWRSMWRLTVWPLTVMVTGLSPLITLVRGLTRLITRRASHHPSVSEDEILAAARLGARGGEISKLERDLITNIIRLEDIRASDIMTPRTVMLAVEGARPVSQVRPEARQWPHTRVPVFQETLDGVVGYVLRSDVLDFSDPDQDPAVSQLSQPVSFVPGSANALNLLKSFLRRREHLYMVVDEYGGTMGVVTLEDVLESLVGSEIVDEKDLVDDMQEMARSMARQQAGARDGEGMDD